MQPLHDALKAVRGEADAYALDMGSLRTSAGRLVDAAVAAAQIAAALGVTLEEFSAWSRRLVAARVFDNASVTTTTTTTTAAVVTPQTEAARVFEGGPAMDGIMER